MTIAPLAGGALAPSPLPRSSAPFSAFVRPHGGRVTGPPMSAARALDRVQVAQIRLDRILALAQSGRTFSPAELLAFQTQVFQASHEIDLAGRIVEKATGGIKQVLQTQV